MSCSSFHESYSWYGEEKLCIYLEKLFLGVFHGSNNRFFAHISQLSSIWMGMPKKRILNLFIIFRNFVIKFVVTCILERKNQQVLSNVSLLFSIVVVDKLFKMRLLCEQIRKKTKVYPTIHLTIVSILHPLYHHWSLADKRDADNLVDLNLSTLSLWWQSLSIAESCQQFVSIFLLVVDHANCFASSLDSGGSSIR